MPQRENPFALGPHSHRDHVLTVLVCIQIDAPQDGNETTFAAKNAWSGFFGKKSFSGWDCQAAAFS
jgi:hypothetical protein